MNDLSAIKAHIEDAFSGGVYPGDWCLINGREGTEPALLEEEFKGKTDWRTLDPTFIDRAPDGFGTALHFFSDEAFRFYLPAYMLADLDGRLQQADVVFALTHGFDNESRDEKINPRRYGERTWFDYARFKYAMFTVRQVRAIFIYLAFKAESDSITDYERQRIRQALDNYWAARAS